MQPRRLRPPAFFQASQAQAARLFLPREHIALLGGEIDATCQRFYNFIAASGLASGR